MTEQNQKIKDWITANSPALYMRGTSYKDAARQVSKALGFSVSPRRISRINRNQTCMEHWHGFTGALCYREISFAAEQWDRLLMVLEKDRHLYVGKDPELVCRGLCDRGVREPYRRGRYPVPAVKDAMILLGLIKRDK